MAIKGFSGSSTPRDPVDAKVSELTPTSRAVNVIAKVVSKSEIREISGGRDGADHRVCDALVGDETGCVYLTLWDDNIEKVNENDTVKVGNGYINLFKGNMRLNVGKYGTLEVAEEEFTGDVNTENNLSDKVYEQQRRFFSRLRCSDYHSSQHDLYTAHLVCFVVSRAAPTYLHFPPRCNLLFIASYILISLSSCPTTALRYNMSSLSIPFIKDSTER